MKSSNSPVRLAAVSRSSPYMRPTKFKYSAPVSRPNKAMPSGTTPICRFTSTICFSKSRPRICMVPEVGASNPVSILMVVDFPAPLGPRKPKNWPDATRRLTSWTATNSPNRRVNPSVAMAGASIKCSTLAHPPIQSEARTPSHRVMLLDSAQRSASGNETNPSATSRFQSEGNEEVLETGLLLNTWLRTTRKIKRSVLAVCFCFTTATALAQDPARTIHVFGALADNQPQGIIPVPPTRQPRRSRPQPFLGCGLRRKDFLRPPRPLGAAGGPTETEAQNPRALHLSNTAPNPST